MTSEDKSKVNGKIIAFAFRYIGEKHALGLVVANGDGHNNITYVYIIINTNIYLYARKQNMKTIVSYKR